MANFRRQREFLFMDHVERRSRAQAYTPREYKVVALRECPLPADMMECTTPEHAHTYWSMHVPKDPRFNPDVECFVVLALNTRRKIRGHYLVSTGILDTILVHPREVFKPAIVLSAAAVVLLHNHPSGEPSPSESDIKVTRDLIRAGQILKIEVLDHVIVGRGLQPWVSLRALGYFYS